MSAYYDSRVEYIESTGTLYIDTEIIASMYIGTSITFESTLESYDNSEYTLMGVGDVNRTRWGLMYYLQNDNTDDIRCSHLCTSTNAYYRKSGVSRGKHKILYNYNLSYEFYVDGELIESSISKSSGSTYAYNIILFGRNNNGSIIEKIKARIYSCRITLNNEIVRDFIPVRVGQVGYLYDKVSGQLFGNSGSGSFALGLDIQLNLYSLDYIKNFRRRLMLSSAFDYDSYLTFKAITDCNFTFVSNLTDRGPIQYSINNGSWLLASSVAVISSTTYTFPLVKAGSIILFKASFTIDSYYNKTSTYHYYFTSDGQFEAWGDPWSLYFPEDFKNQTFNVNQTFRGLFASCTGLISAEHMSLFAPELLDYTYLGMFDSCSNLVKAPQIKATEVGAYSCYSMFYGCTSLTDVPDLKIMTFNGDNACRSMFAGCTSLVKAPTLPATTLAKYCYYLLFRNNSNLNYIKSLNVTTPSATYNSNWVSGVAASGTFVKNINATWTVTGVNGVPSGWTILYFDPDTEKYYLSDKTTECDEYGNVI